MDTGHDYVKKESFREVCPISVYDVTAVETWLEDLVRKGYRPIGFAGGKVEAGESEEDALRREIFEELGAKIQVGGLFCRLEHDYPDFSVRLSVYFCKFLTPYFSKEHEALAWLPIEELDAAEWAPADAPAVERLKKLYREGGAAFYGIRQAEDEKR